MMPNTQHPWFPQQIWNEDLDQDMLAHSIKINRMMAEKLSLASAKPEQTIHTKTKAAINRRFYRS